MSTENSNSDTPAATSVETQVQNRRLLRQLKIQTPNNQLRQPKQPYSLISIDHKLCEDKLNTTTDINHEFLFRDSVYRNRTLTL